MVRTQKKQPSRLTIRHPSAIRRFLRDLPADLDLRAYGNATVHAPSGVGRDSNSGYDAFVPLIDSGISLYVWTSSRFLALVIFTCKAFG